MSLFDENYRNKLIQEIIYWKIPQRLSPGPGLGAFLGVADKRERELLKRTLLQLSEHELNEAHAAARIEFELKNQAHQNDTCDIPDLSGFVKIKEHPENQLQQWKLNNDDIEYWCNLEYWTINEFIALSFDLCPTKATPENLAKFRRLIPETTYKNILQRTEICRRAHDTHQLQTKTKPLKFIKWSKNKNISLPETIVLKLENAASSSPRIAEQTSTEGPTQNGLPKHDNQQKASAARSDASLYKILYAVAVSRYKFDSTKRNSPTPSRILADLERVGLTMDVATIKSHLIKAADIVDEIKSIS